MRAFQEENATDDVSQLQLLHEQYAEIVEDLLDDFSDVQACTPKLLSRACAILVKRSSRSAQKVSRYISASSDFSVFQTMMAGGASRRKSTVTTLQGGGVDEGRIRELLEKQMQGQQHDIHAMMALVQSLAQGGGGAAALEQQMSMLKLQQEQVLQERERLAAEIAKMQSMQGGSSSSSSKKDETLDAAVVAAEKQEEAATELEALRLDSAAIASLSSHELAAKALSLGVTPGSDDDDVLRARLIEHVARKSQMLSASVDAEKLRQEQAMQERMQRLKTEREAARSKLASAIAAAESGDVTVAAAAAADAAAAAAAATGDASVISTIDTADSGETDDEKRQKLVKQLQVGRGRTRLQMHGFAPLIHSDTGQATMATLDSSVSLEKERQDVALQQVSSVWLDAWLVAEVEQCHSSFRRSKSARLSALKSKRRRRRRQRRQQRRRQWQRRQTLLLLLTQSVTLLTVPRRQWQQQQQQHRRRQRTRNGLECLKSEIACAVACDVTVLPPLPPCICVVISLNRPTVQVSEEAGCIGQVGVHSYGWFFNDESLLIVVASVLDIERSRQEDALAARLAGDQINYRKLQWRRRGACVDVLRALRYCSSQGEKVERKNGRGCCIFRG